MTKLLRNFYLSVILFSCCSTLSMSQENWETLDSEEYFIQFPSEWNLNESGLMGTKFILFSPIEENDSFSDNINLIYQKNDSKTSNEDLIKASKDGILKYFEKAEILSSETTTENGIEKHQFIYKGIQNNRMLQWKQYFFFSGDDIYILTFTSEETNYNSLISTADKILNSFKLKQL